MLDAADNKLPTNSQIEMRRLEHASIVEKNRLGMLTFLASEAVFFLLLILAYIFYQGKNFGGPSASDALEVGKTGVFSLFLFASSGTIFLAERSLKKQNKTYLAVWLVVTVVLGAVFLVGQGLEYLSLFERNIFVSTNQFGTTFFTLTGFHGLHVFAGLVMLTSLAGFAIAGKFKSSHSSALDVISYYWHFVDVVWVIIFTLIYIIGVGFK